MFFDPKQGRSSQRHHHDPRAFAWELMVGFPPGRQRPHHGRGPHRGELPDVILPPPPPRESLFPKFVKRVVRMFRSRADADSRLSASAEAPLGEWIDPDYLRMVERVRAQHEAGSKAKSYEDLAA
ncbi:MAG TPA: hypothetical protein VMF90_04620 [Rhizobiaceae bacterium]|nr:hypothetical protein [Rhizobiaceae bacterium]